MGPIAHSCAKAFVPVCAYGRVTWNFAADDACDLLQNLRSFTVLILTRSESKGACVCSVRVQSKRICGPTLASQVPSLCCCCCVCAIRQGDVPSRNVRMSSVRRAESGAGVCPAQPHVQQPPAGRPLPVCSVRVLCARDGVYASTNQSQTLYPQLLSSVGGAHSARLRESLRAGVRVWEGHVELCS